MVIQQKNETAPLKEQIQFPKQISSSATTANSVLPKLDASTSVSTLHLDVNSLPITQFFGNQPRSLPLKEYIKEDVIPNRTKEDNIEHCKSIENSNPDKEPAQKPSSPKMSGPDSLSIQQKQDFAISISVFGMTCMEKILSKEFRFRE